MSSALSFDDLLQGLAQRYEELRFQNAELLSAAQNGGNGFQPKCIEHHEQIVWQDWQMDDIILEENKNLEEIPEVRVTKPVPSSPWQQSHFETRPQDHEDKMNGGPQTSPRSPNGRHDVSRQVAAVKAPPQTDVDIDGLDREDMRASATMESTFGANASLDTTRIEEECAARDSTLTGEERAAQERRFRRQFKRLTEPGRRRLFAWQAWQIIEQMETQGSISGPVPTMEKLAEALFRHVSLTYPSEVDRLTNMEANIPDIVERAEESCPEVYLNASLDLEAYFAIMLGECDALIERIEPSLANAIKVMQNALLQDSQVNDDGSQGEGPYLPLLTSNRLDTISAFVILINAVVIGVSADVEPEHTLWEVFEVLFTIFFLAEMLYKIRLNGLKNFFAGAASQWNNFDAIVVSIALFDLSYTWIMKVTNPGGGDEENNLGSFTIIKMARLGRLARLIRLLRFRIFEQLKMMIQGVIAGLRVLFWAVILLFFFVYLLGVMLRKTIGHSDIHHYVVYQSFETVPRSMLTLFRCFTDGCAAYDGTPLQVHLFEYYGAFFMIQYMLVYLFVTMGIFNLIMAIFIDNVMEASVHRKQQERGASAEYMEVTLKELVANLIRHQSRPKKRSTFHRQTLGKVSSKVYNLLDLDMDPNQSTESRMTCINAELEQLGADDLTIDRDLFKSWLEEPAFLQMLDDLDIGTSNKSELFDVLDADLSGELEVDEVISGLMKLRGPSDKSDAVASLLGIRYITQQIDSIHDKVYGPNGASEAEPVQRASASAALSSALLNKYRPFKGSFAQRRSGKAPLKTSVINGKPKRASQSDRFSSRRFSSTPQAMSSRGSVESCTSHLGMPSKL